MNITTTVSGSQPRQFTGLLGNLDGNPGDDLKTRSGKIIPSKSSYGKLTQALSNVLPTPIPLTQIENTFFKQLYREFGNSWRIRQEESLFDYAPGQSTATFTDRSFPKAFLTLGSLLPAQIRSAEATCRKARVEEILMEGCIFDVGMTGNAGFAKAAVNALTKVVIDRAIDRAVNEVRDRIPFPIPIPRLPF